VGATPESERDRGRIRGFPLTDCDETADLCLTDAALIDLNNAHDNSTKTLVAQVYRTSFSSSTGSGSSTISGTPFSMVTTGSPVMGMDVNKVGIRTGWTTGEITRTCAHTSINVRHASDGKLHRTRLYCYILADTPVNSGDSGSALFATINDGSSTDGIFLGILSQVRHFIVLWKYGISPFPFSVDFFSGIWTTEIY